MSTFVTLQIHFLTVSRVLKETWPAPTAERYRILRSHTTRTARSSTSAVTESSRSTEAVRQAPSTTRKASNVMIRKMFLDGKKWVFTILSFIRLMHKILQAVEWLMKWAFNMTTRYWHVWKSGKMDKRWSRMVSYRNRIRFSPDDPISGSQFSQYKFFYTNVCVVQIIRCITVLHFYTNKHLKSFSNFKMGRSQ